MSLWKSNKYTKWYFELMDKAKDMPKIKGEYYEKHHILPKSLGGSNDKENLVFLSAREHFLSHLMLVRMAHFTYAKMKMQKAAHFFIANHRHNNLKINCNTYGLLKKQHSEAMRARKHTPEEIEKRRLANTGKKRTEEQKRRMSEAQQKLKETDPEYFNKHSQRFKEWHANMSNEKRNELKANQSKAALNRAPHTDEAKKKISEAFKGKPLSEEHKKRISGAHQKRSGSKEVKYKEIIQWAIEKEDGSQIMVTNLNIWAQENGIKSRTLYGTEGKNKWCDGFRIAKREIILVPREKK